MDHRAKLQWARKHYDALDNEVRVFIEIDPYEMRAKYDAEKGGYIAWLEKVTDLPPHWSLMVGDIIQNTRSALDTLTYALACKNLRRIPDEAEVKQLQFVIVDDIKDLAGEFSRRLKFLDHDARAEICWIQPCFRTDFSQRHPLSVLRDLSNIDKHRHLVITLASASSSSIELSGDYIDAGTTIEGYIGPLEKGTEIGRWNFRFGESPIPPHLHGKVEAYGKLGLDIEFAKSTATPKGGSVMGFLPALHDFIETVIFPPLEEILAGPSRLSHSSPQTSQGGQMDPMLLEVFQGQVLVQCEFLLLAAAELDTALEQHNVRRAFYALQSILNAAGNASKALWGQSGETEVAARRKPLRDSIELSDDSPLQSVRVRNHFEHFDNRVDDWWEKSTVRAFVDMNIGIPVGGMGFGKYDWFRNFDPQTGDLTFWGDQFNIRAIVNEVIQIVPKLKEAIEKGR